MRNKANDGNHRMTIQMQHLRRHARLFSVLLMACVLSACEREVDAKSVADTIRNISEEQRERIRQMEKAGPPTFNGTRLYTGPHRTPAKMEGLTIVGYNYTDAYISDFSVNGVGGGNIEVSSREHSYGGGTCCAAVPADTPLPLTVRIEWKRDGDVPRCRQTVLLDGPVPADPRYFEVHFYQDGKIKVALSDYPSVPHVLIDRFDATKRKASGNVVNDTKFSTCGHDK